MPKLNANSKPFGLNSTGVSRSRWLPLEISYFPAALALIFTVTSAFFLWKARTDELAATEYQQESKLLLNQVNGLARIVDVASAMPLETSTPKNLPSTGNGRRLAIKHCEEALKDLSQTLDSTPYVPALKHFVPHCKG